MKKTKKKIAGIMTVIALIVCFCINVWLSPLIINVQAAENSSEIIYGADIGYLSQLESLGIQWVDDDGNTEDGTH